MKAVVTQRAIAQLLLLLCSTYSTGSTQATEPNGETQAWWEHVRVLADDSMEGRDTGSGGHRRAAQYVADQLKANGVMPAGNDGYFQTVPIRALDLVRERSGAAIRRGRRDTSLTWLHQIRTGARRSPASISGPMIFAGSDNAAGLATAGAVIVRLNPELGVPAPAQPAPPADAVAVIGIDTPIGLEPRRWPEQGAIGMRLADEPPPDPAAPIAFRFNPAEADVLLRGTGHTYRQLLELTNAGHFVPSFALRGTFSANVQYEESILESDNVIGVLRGDDPVLDDQYVVISAHLDGYGIGEPWGRDNIYNGAFDDAAYVATLIEFAKRLRESGTRPRRSILFAIVTGEERGLLGSRYFAQHPTVPRERLVANVNLDQLRPVFPLHTLTMHAINDTTLGDTAREIAAGMDIRLQADPEPERDLLRRSDLRSFVEIGVPGTGFLFAYTPGTPEEGAYRRWYADRYHTPLDDLSQPWVPEAAAKFNEFFERFVMAIANDDNPPKWKEGSAIAPKPN